jgi:hypothetical protein
VKPIPPRMSITILITVVRTGLFILVDDRLIYCRLVD